MKKVLLIVIDALASRVLGPGIANGELRHFARLTDVGMIDFNCTPVFPSITPAATSSIVTGCYPREHGISGAYFYDVEQHQVDYYGDDLWTILQEGLGKFFEDFLIRLNHQRLRSPTLFQLVERAGLTAACINYLVFHGDHSQQVNVPLLLKLLPGVPFSETVMGPSTLFLGDLVQNRAGSQPTPHRRGGPSRRYGFHDDITGDLLLQLFSQNDIPDFTLAYFPNNDYDSHRYGPLGAKDTIANIDSQLGELIANRGGLTPFLDEFAVIVTGDHSQTEVIDDADRAGIDLSELLSDYSQGKTGQPWQADQQIMICANLRAAQIYVREELWNHIDRIVEPLLADMRIDQVIWRVGTQQPTYQIATSDRGTLRFSKRELGSGPCVDCHGGRWFWEGRLEAIDAEIRDTNSIVFCSYPNAFERIAGSFDDEVSGDLWLTARPGFEFHGDGTRTHTGGGSHGALHFLDSQVPLLAAGLPDHVSLPRHPRTVDVAPLCLEILGLGRQLQSGDCQNSYGAAAIASNSGPSVNRAKSPS